MRFSLTPLDLERHLDLLHAWVTHPRSRFWGLPDATKEQVRAEYEDIEGTPHHHALIGLDRGRPTFLVETYDPARSPLAGRSELRPGDLGMHVLVAPPAGEPEPGFTSAVFGHALAHCFSDPAVQRVVVEPDVRNRAIRAKNVAAGFRELGPVILLDKTAMLSVCTRADWHAVAQAAHLAPRHLERAQRHLVAKALSEYAHEQLITPTAAGGGWQVATSGSVYDFTARVHALDHWVIDEESLTRRVDGSAARLDAQELVVELAPVLGIPDPLVPVYLEEIASTLASSAWKLANPQATTAELVEAMSTTETPAAEAFQLVEAAMTEGHPAFVANNGRIGYGLDDYLAYAPETGSGVRLDWVAARGSATTLSLSRGVDGARLHDEQMGEETHARLRHRLEALGLDPDEYVLMPVHPWQWTNKLAVTFAPDVARRDLVHLGPGESTYRTQQSLRTFFDATHPERHYVKVALSIQNMGFMRGLSPRYMVDTPAINDWVADLVRSDEALAERGFDVLREVASVGYTGDAFHRHTGRSAYQKMVAALWRESPLTRTDGEERLATMASLLHRDAAGDAVVTGLVKASGLTAAEWVRAYLRAYLVPVVHCLWAYDLVFMPHGENLILRLRDGVPIGAFMKDIGEEVAVIASAEERPLPERVERIRTECPEDVKALAVHTDVMDGVLRYVAAILAEDGLLDDAGFWAVAREVVEDHLTSHPELSAAAERYDLLRPTFRRSCLNRLQLRNTLEMVDISDQAESLIFSGELDNPLARPTPVSLAE